MKLFRRARSARLKLLFSYSDRCRAQLGRECYPRGNCVASELGRKHTVGQIKMSALFACLMIGNEIILFLCKKKTDMVVSLDSISFG